MPCASTDAGCVYDSRTECQTNSSCKPPTKELEIHLYQGAVPPDASQDPTKFLQYQKSMIDFAKKRGIHRVYIDLVDPSKSVQSIDLMRQVLQYAGGDANGNGAVMVGVVMEAVPEYPFDIPQAEVKKYWTNGTNGTNGTTGQDPNKTAGGMSMFPEEWVIPALPKGATSCSDAVTKALVEPNKECTQNAACAAAAGTHGTWCNMNPESKTGGTCAQCDDPTMPYYTECAYPELPSGCPNQLQVAFTYVNMINQQALKNPPKNTTPSTISSVIVDKENVKEYGGNTYLFIAAAKKWLEVDQQAANVGNVFVGKAGQYSMTPSGLVDEGQQLCESMAKKGLVKGDCSKLDKGTIGVKAYPEYYWYGELKPRGCVGCPHDLTTDMLQKFQTVSDVKNGTLTQPQSCKDQTCSVTGNTCSSDKDCPATPASQNCNKGVCSVSGKKCTQSTDCGAPPLCPETCSSKAMAGTVYDDFDDVVFSSWTEENMSINSCQKSKCKYTGEGCSKDGDCAFFTRYDYCMTAKTKDGAVCPPPCCMNLGCLTCKYNTSPDAQRGDLTKEVIYQTQVNNPGGLLNELTNGTFASLEHASQKSSGNPDAVPMFSNEISHDWDMTTPSTSSTYSIHGAGPQWNPKTCITRQYGNDTCGTFDGFSNWTWDNFHEFLKAYAQKYNLSSIGIYEWQFVPPEWLKD